MTNKAPSVDLQPAHPLPAADLQEVLERVRPAFEALRGARLFITGGTGFFGTWLLETFVHANAALSLQASAVVLSRNPSGFLKRHPHLAANSVLEFVPGDIVSFKFPSGPFTHVLHAATEASAKLNTEQPLQMFDTIVAGTRRALEFAHASGANTFLLASSGAVYGRQPPELTHIPETFTGAPDPLTAASAYGEGKRAAEHLCILHAEKFGLQSKIARCFAFVGPCLPLDAHFAIGNFIRDGLSGGPIRIQGDGTPCRSYMYAADLAAWLWSILILGKSGRAYNVGSDEALTIGEAAQAVAQSFSPILRVEIAKTPDPSRSAERYVPSIARARTDLDLAAWTPLPEAIRRTVAWQLTASRK